MGFLNSSNQGLARPHRRASLRSLFAAGAAAVAAMFVAAPAANATLVSLINQNSIVDFDTQTQAGAYNWIIDGQDVLEKQWFWYRVGPAGPEQSIDTLIQTLVNPSDSDGDALPDTLVVRYADTLGRFTLETKYSLLGNTPGSGLADLGEQLTIKNTSGAPLDFHFYQYVDLDLSPIDSVAFVNANAVDQFGTFGTASETVNTPTATHREAGFFPVTLGKLNDALPSVLNDVLVAGPGDVTWAHEWDVTLTASGLGSSYSISKDKLVAIPEPTSLALLGVAAGAGLLRRRR